MADCRVTAFALDAPFATNPVSIPLVLPSVPPILDSSSKSSTASKKFLGERPELEPPSSFPPPPASIVSFMETVESIREDCLRVVEASTKNLRATYTEIYQAERAHLAEYRKEEASRDWWDFLKKIAVCVLGTFSVVAGGVAIAAATNVVGVVVGGAMIFSGIASLVGNILKELNVQPELGNALMIIGSVVALIGGGLNIFFGTLTLENTILNMVAAFLSFSEQTTEVIRTTKDMELSSLKGSLALLENQQSATKYRIKELTENCHQFQQTTHAIAQNATKALKEYLDACQAMTRWSGFA